MAGLRGEVRAEIPRPIPRASRPWRLPDEILRGYPEIRTRNVDAAAAAAGQLFAPLTLEVVYPHSEFEFSLRRDQTPDIWCSYTTYRTGVSIRSAGLSSNLAISIPVSGSISGVQSGVEFLAAPGEVWVLPAAQALSARLSSDSAMLTLLLPTRMVALHLRGLVGRAVEGPVNFEPISDLRTWRPILALAAQVFTGTGGPTPSPLLLAHFVQLVLTTLVLTHRHPYSDALFAAPCAISPRSLKTVREAIETRSQEPWTVPALAALAGVSVRSLQLAFQRELGMPPSSYLEEIRLQRAHERLRTEGSRTTIAEVALECGFANAGRFSARYRRRFGCLPSETKLAMRGPEKPSL